MSSSLLSTPLDWSNPCVREELSAFAPFVLVVVLCFPYSLVPKVDFFKLQFKPFLTLSEAESYVERNVYSGQANNRARSWMAFVPSALSIFQSAVWTVVTAYFFINRLSPLYSSLSVFSWLYATFYSFMTLKATISYRLFVFYIVEFFGSLLVLGGAFLDYHNSGRPLFPDPFVSAHLLNAVTSSSLVLISFSRPLTWPSCSTNKLISPEDTTTLWRWMSFSWVTPFIRKASSHDLNEDDVWRLSPTMAARPVFMRFSEAKGKSLLRRLWVVVSRDLILDFLFNLASVFLKYLQPFFIKQIIDSFNLQGPEVRSRAFAYACLMFVSQVIRAETDIQHSWCSRHAEAQLKTVLMAAIYDKALKRKDISGVVNKHSDRQDESVNNAKKDETGADVGKIVNLMSGDANRVAQIASGMYFIYGCPIDVIIAGIFLYRLLGFSAFAGLLVLLLGWPLNSILSRRAINISRESLAARDKRMSVLNELLSSIKFIKFFAWEDRWIARVFAARQKELDWLIKSRVNDVLYQAVWTATPVLISIVAFFAFIVQGNELTVGTAFTALMLFSMIRPPMNIIPTFIVQILQTRVALHRIESFLAEDEVDEQVSTLKRTLSNAPVPSLDKFGFKMASFIWNSAGAKERDASKVTIGKETDATVLGAVHGIASGSNLDAMTTEETDRNFQLKDISVIFPEGKLSIVTGSTASGKTALLLALLGEMTLIGGQILVYKQPEKVDEHGLTHSISYAAQTPWLQHQSIKENILFGSPYEEGRYKAVVECCALLPDLDILEDGDETEIGARGVTLSGGQKARVALARATYARTRYVLLDDPLSAVDSHTSRFLYERLFLGPLMKHRTIILITHHVDLVLPAASYLVRMSNGQIEYQGTIDSLRERNLLGSSTGAANVQGEGKKKVAELEKQAAEGGSGGREADTMVEGVARKPKKLVLDEHREVGNVKWTIYKTYLKATSYRTWIILFVFIICTQLLGFAEKYWIKVWAGAYSNSLTSSTLNKSSPITFGNSQSPLYDTISPDGSTHIQVPSESSDLQVYLPRARENPLFYVFVYALIGLTTVVVSVMSVSTQYLGALRASRLLFRHLLGSVVRATMRWYDVTPTGRVLNRFSRDIETIDVNLASSLQTLNSNLATFFSSAIIIIVVFPPFTIPAIVIAFCYYRLAVAYLNTGRGLKRMESTSRSPLFSGFGELLEGVVTVRAFSAESRFLTGFFDRVDLTQRMWYFFWMINRWLMIRLDMLSAAAVFITVILSLSMDSSDSGDWAGWAALSITSAMAFTSNIYWTCRNWTQLELDLNSVERVVEYLDLPQEPPAVIENSRPPAHWPTSTGPNADSLLVVEGLEVQYAPDLPAVLHDVSFSLKARERIGLLGRTGSGKSTLAMSILRFVDPVKGKILIDGIDISTIGIHDLRSRLTFIPQDATLFSGTLRDNLDPFGDYSDTECLDVLHHVQLTSKSLQNPRKSSRQVSRTPSIHEREETDATVVDCSSKAPSEAPISVTSSITEFDRDGASSKGEPKITLETDVSAGGLNFSAGQRQLIAMARALLRQSAVVILDEATSSIDFETDAIIQKAIREEFRGSLLLTIAHRLRTVIDYDRLIVLDAGSIVEFDTPHNLIQREGGTFREMCLNSGSFAELEAAAKAKATQDAKASMF